MSILQIEISDETRARIEAQAQSEGRDLGSWLLELAERELRSSQDEDAERRYIESELLQALESPAIEVTPQWWAQFEKETMQSIDAEHAK